MRLTLGDGTTIDIEPGAELTEVRLRPNTFSDHRWVPTADVAAWARDLLREIDGPSIDDVRGCGVSGTPTWRFRPRTCSAGSRRRLSVYGMAHATNVSMRRRCAKPCRPRTTRAWRGQPQPSRPRDLPAHAVILNACE